MLMQIDEVFAQALKHRRIECFRGVLYAAFTGTHAVLDRAEHRRQEREVIAGFQMEFELGEAFRVLAAVYLPLVGLREGVGGTHCLDYIIGCRVRGILLFMDLFTIALIVLGMLLVQGIGLYLVLRRREAAPKEDASAPLLMQRLEGLERSLDSRMAESSKQLHETVRTQLGESSRLIKEITAEITSVKEIGRQTQTYAEQLQSLQDLLKNPKQRGILGEYYLETVLKNVLPPGMYQMQYPFKNGEIVDAAVFVNEKLVPIDSKFSLDNYNRFVSTQVGSPERVATEKAFVNDLKLRITETAKYIRPEEGTMDFAFMFIPSEGIYYDLLTNQVGAGEDENLIQRAASKHKVIIVSPTSFLAYLQTVMQGLKAMQIEQRAEEIQKRVGELGKHIGAFDSFYKKLGMALGTTVSHFNSGYKELGKIDKDVYRIAESKIGIETELLDKPVLEVE
jgi:DNA recombination protein RmuC